MRPIGPSDPGFDARVDTCSWEHSAFRAQSVPEETDLNGPALEAYLDTFEACLRSRDVEFERSGAVFTYPDPAVTDTEGFRRSTFRCTSEATAAEYRLRTSQQPSQSAQDAQRDNVVPGLAALPIHERVAILSWVNTSEGTWALSRPPQTNGGQFLAGPVVGDPAGTRGVDMISLVEYGELLLLDDNGQIVKAYPMPGAPPTWILAAPPFLYAGRTGDGALPDSTLVRIDRSTLEAAFVVVPAALDGATQWPPEWFLAPADIANGYGDLVEIRPRPTAESGGEASPGEMIGESLIGLVVVDRDGVDAFINETIQRGTLISDTPPALVDAVYPTMTTIEARRLLDSDDPLPDRGDLAIEYATEILGLEDPFAWLERTESDRRIWQIDSNTLSVLVAIEARGHRSNGETLYVITSASTFADGEWDLSLAVNPVEGIWTVESSFPEFGVEATVTYAANGWETSGATGTGEIKLTLPEEPLTTARFTVAYTDTAGNIVGYHSTLWPAGD